MSRVGLLFRCAGCLLRAGTGTGTGNVSMRASGPFLYHVSRLASTTTTKTTKRSTVKAAAPSPAAEVPATSSKKNLSTKGATLTASRPMTKKAATGATTVKTVAEDVTKPVATAATTANKQTRASSTKASAKTSSKTSTKAPTKASAATKKKAETSPSPLASKESKSPPKTPTSSVASFPSTGSRKAPEKPPGKAANAARPPIRTPTRPAPAEMMSKAPHRVEETTQVASDTAQGGTEKRPKQADLAPPTSTERASTTSPVNPPGFFAGNPVKRPRSPAEQREYDRKYKQYARIWTTVITCLPLFLVSSYYLFDRLVLGNEPKPLPPQFRSPATLDPKSGETGANTSPK